ncbi:ABC transporter permease [Eisenbergiella sp.]
MNTINTTACANLKQNRGRNLLTGIAIMLTAFLIFTITTLGSGVIRFQFHAANQLYPTYHIMYRDVPEQTAAELARSADIEQLGLRQDTAQVRQGETVCRLIYLDEAGLELGRIDLESGRFPAGKNEIAVSQGMLQAFSIQADIGDVITLPLQPIEAHGLGFEKEYTFTICGILPTPETEEDNQLYSALVSAPFVRELLPASDRLYRVMVRLANAQSYTTDAIIQKGERVAEAFSIPKGNISENSPYLIANYIDPTFYSSIAAILVVVVLAGIITIYSIYYVSTMYKVQEYGKLKALGATSKQVRSIVFREGMLTALLAIPVGLLAGTVASYGAFSFFLNNFSGNDVLGDTLKAAFNGRELPLLQGWVYAFTAAVTLVTTAVSLRRPVRIASKISPVEAMRYDGPGCRTKEKQRRGYADISLFRLVKANLSRNRKRTMITLAALSVTGILFLAVSAVLSCADPAEIAHDQILYDLELSIYAISGDKMRPEFEWTAIQQDNPLDDALEKQVRSIPGVTRLISQLNTDVLLTDVYDGDELWSTSISGVPEELAAEMEKSVIQGTISYEELLDGDKIILNKKAYHWSPEWQIGSRISMLIEDGGRQIPKTFTVAAIADPPVYLNYYAPFMVPSQVLEKLCVNNQMYHWSIQTEPGQRKAAEEQLRQIVQENQFLKLGTFEEELAERAELSGITSAVCYLFLSILGGICIMNLINTMTNSVYVRRRELGMMQALGMSEKQLSRLFRLEGLFYTLGSLGFSIAFGSLFGYVFYVKAKASGFLSIVSYHYPYAQTLVLFLAIAAIQLLMTWILARSFRKQSLIDRIRFSE